MCRLLLTETARAKIFMAVPEVIAILLFFTQSGNSINVGTIELPIVLCPVMNMWPEPFQEDNLTLYLLATGRGLYSYDKLDIVYAEGDYLYLKRNFCQTPTGEVVTELPVGTIYKKYLNITAGDSWQQTEVIYPGNVTFTSTVYVDNCGVEFSNSDKLFTRKTPRQHCC
jgi:hypothetical protein